MKTFELINTVETIDKNWYLWTCKVFDHINDECMVGTVQARDDSNIAYETFEED